jgi:hypothetical protein
VTAHRVARPGPPDVAVAVSRNVGAAAEALPHVAQLFADRWQRLVAAVVITVEGKGVKVSHRAVIVSPPMHRAIGDGPQPCRT